MIGLPILTRQHIPIPQGQHGPLPHQSQVPHAVELTYCSVAVPQLGLYIVTPSNGKFAGVEYGQLPETGHPPGAQEDHTSALKKLKVEGGPANVALGVPDVPVLIQTKFAPTTLLVPTVPVKLYTIELPAVR